MKKYVILLLFFIINYSGFGGCVLVNTDIMISQFIYYDKFHHENNSPFIVQTYRLQFNSDIETFDFNLPEGLNDNSLNLDFNGEILNKKILKNKNCILRLNLKRNINSNQELKISYETTKLILNTGSEINLTEAEKTASIENSININNEADFNYGPVNICTIFRKNGKEKLEIEPFKIDTAVFAVETLVKNVNINPCDIFSVTWLKLENIKYEILYETSFNDRFYKFEKKIILSSDKLVKIPYGIATIKCINNNSVKVLSVNYSASSRYNELAINLGKEEFLKREYKSDENYDDKSDRKIVNYSIKVMNLSENENLPVRIRIENQSKSEYRIYKVLECDDEYRTDNFGNSIIDLKLNKEKTIKLKMQVEKTKIND